MNGNQCEQGQQRKSGDGSKDACIRTVLRRESERKGSDRLHHQEGPANASHDMAVTRRPEESERDGSARDRDQPVCHPKHHHESGRDDDRDAEHRKQREGEEQHADRKPCHIEGVNAPGEYQLAYPR